MFITLYGAEPFLAEEKLKEIVGKYKTAHKSGLNLHFFDADDFELDDFKQALETVSMFDEKKLIVLKNFFLEDAKMAKDILALAGAFGAEESKDVVIIFFESGMIEKNKDFDKLLKKPNMSQEFKSLEGAALVRWIEKEFEKLGSKIEPKAITLLIKYAGQDLYRLKNEIDKLAAYSSPHLNVGCSISLKDIDEYNTANNKYNIIGERCGDKKSITEKDIAEMVAPDFHSDIFAVIDAIAKKDKKSALKILNDHIENGESEIYLLTMIIFQFRNLLRVKSLAEEKASADSITKKTGLHPFVVKKSLAASLLFSLDELKNIYRKLFDIDLKIKIGEMEPSAALNLFVVEL